MDISAFVLLVLFLFLFFIFIVYILSFFRKKENYEGTLKELPNISVLIPAYNEEKNIGRCISSVMTLDYDKDKMEIIVIDDGSTDKTKEIAESLGVRVIRGEHKGKVDALNLGVKEAKNEIIFCVDADVTLDKKALKKMVAPLSEKDVAATNAVVLVNRQRKLIDFFQYVEYYYNNIIRTSFSRLFRNSIWFFGAVACYKKSALEKIGYFKKDTLTEDMDVCLELYRADYRIITVEDAIIYTNPCSNLYELFRQRMRWYFGALQGLVKNHTLFKKKIRSVPVVFLFKNQFWWTFYAFVSFPLIIYQVIYWFPSSGISEGFWYIFRWFSLAGPFYVLYKIPQGWLSFLNISGISAGILTFIFSSLAILKFKGKFNIKTLLAIFFYFPYTIILNTIIVVSMFYYGFSKKKYFKE